MAYSNSATNPRTLAIETSCDETAVAIYERGKGVLSSILFSQATELHAAYGGVMPEEASRSHIEKIEEICRGALQEADITLSGIDHIAVTVHPGLPGSLLIGVAFAKALAYALQKPLIGVNHLEGHVFSSFLEQTPPFPHLCLTASGGHTALYWVSDFGAHELLASTRDDAAGEAFDKVSKMMGLSYPGGPVIERLAKKAAFQDFFKYPRLKNEYTDFSFSGLKTAVLYDLIKKKAYDAALKKFCVADPQYAHALRQQVASSFLVCVGDIFEQRLQHFRRLLPTAKALTFVGGVACNAYLCNRLGKWAEHQQMQFFHPTPRYCTDNAAMIAFVGDYKAREGLFADLLLDIY